MKVCPKCERHYADDANFCPVDAAKLVSASQAVPVIAANAANNERGLLGGRFERGQRLGGGPSGEVYRAVDTQSGGAVAVKLVSPQVLAIPQVAQRAERELKQLERVEHRAIARVLASGKHGAQLWVAMELVENAQTLANLVASSGPLDPQVASEVVVGVGEALIEAAKVGVVHRDLAPKNVLVSGAEVKLINFCIPVPTSDKVPGVPEFVAPDLIEGKPVDQRSNIYSLGALYYFLLTGQPPFSGDPATVHQAHLSAAPVPPSQRAPVPADVDGVVAKAMERSAAKRYLTLRQFLDEIERIARGPEEAAGAGGAPFSRKKGALAQTMLGVSPGAGAATRQVDVQIPAEARREPVVAAGVIEPRPAAAAPAAPPQASVESPWAPAGVPSGVPGYPASPAATPAAAAAPAPAAAAPPQATIGGYGAAAVPAAPAVAPPAPMVASPTLPPAGASGKKKTAPDEKKAAAANKGKFRETMWFKKGDLDAAAAEAAAEEAKQGKEAALDKADSMPIDERYSDDGSITRGDAERYSLKTGSTQMMQAVRSDQAGAAASGKVSEDELIGEMKGGRGKLIAIAVAVVLVLVIAVILFAR